MPDAAYDRLALVYDRLQEDVDQAAWAEYVCQLDLEFSDRSPEGDGADGRPLLLDLGCGTGGFCLEMARRGYDPIGIDVSPSMLEVARDKWRTAVKKDPNLPQALFLQQNISQYELYGTVDLIVCLLDTMNHLTRPVQVQNLFRLCANYLNPGGLFIFDLLNHDYMSRTLGDNFFYQDRTDFTLFWQNQYQGKTGISRSELTFFLKQADGRYIRAEEVIVEKYYSPESIARYLQKLPLQLLRCYAPLCKSDAAETDDRQVYIIRKT